MISLVHGTYHICLGVQVGMELIYNTALTRHLLCIYASYITFYGFGYVDLLVELEIGRCKT